MQQQRSLLFVVVLASLSCACDGFTLFVSAGPLRESRTSPTAPPPPRTIGLGDVVNGTFVLPEVHFDLQAPRSGLLFIQITWDRRHGGLDLAFLSTAFSTQASHDVSIVGTMQISQGQSYRITVVGDHGPVPFTLTTSMP
jgi:hypothetical protein